MYVCVKAKLTLVRFFFNFFFFAPSPNENQMCSTVIITFKFALHNFISNCDSEVEKTSVDGSANILQIFFPNIFLN